MAGFVRGWNELIERHGRLLEVSLSTVLVLALAVPIVVAARRDTLTKTSFPSRFSRENLLPNPGFEQDTRYWGSYTSTPITRTTRVKAAGEAAARVAAGGSAPARYGAYSGGVRKPVIGDRYVFSVWLRAARATVGKPIVVALETADATGNASQTVGSRTVLLPDRWRRFSVAGVVRPPARVAVIVRVFRFRGVAGGDSFYIDRARLRLASSP